MERNRKTWKEMERNGKKWKEMERDGKKWKETERNGKNEPAYDFHSSPSTAFNPS
jgi:hypothetical protein